MEVPFSFCDKHPFSRKEIDLLISERYLYPGISKCFGVEGNSLAWNVEAQAALFVSTYVELVVCGIVGNAFQVVERSVG